MQGNKIFQIDIGHTFEDSILASDYVRVIRVRWVQYERGRGYSDNNSPDYLFRQ